MDENPSTTRSLSVTQKPSLARKADRTLRKLAFALFLTLAGCLGQDGLGGIDPLTGSVDLRVDGSSSDAVADDGATDGALDSSDGSEVASDAAEDSVETDSNDAATDGSTDNGDEGAIVTDAGADAADATDATDASDAADASDVPALRCGDGICTLVSGEMCATCPIDCGACPVMDAGTDTGIATDTGTDVPADRGTDTGPVDAGSDTGPTDTGVDAPPVDVGPPPPRCGDGTCNGTDTCTSCPIDCGACPPIDAGSDVPVDTGTDVPTDHGTDAGTDAGPADLGTDTGPPDVGTDVVDVPVDTGPPPPRCGDGTCNGTDTCTSCPADCGACPPRCGDGTCNGIETCAGCAADCTPVYPTLVMDITGVISTRMTHLDVRFGNDVAPITDFARDACRGGFTVIGGGFRCVIDVARVMACRPWPTGYVPSVHVVFRDSSMRPIITGRTPGTTAAVCYTTAGDFPCLTSACNARTYGGAEYVVHTSDVDPTTGADLFFLIQGFPESLLCLP